MSTPHGSSRVATASDLRKFEIFQNLDDRDLTNIASQIRVKKYNKDQQIIGQYEEDKNVYFLLEGTVYINVYSAKGREVMFRDLKSGDMFGELAAIDGKPRSADAVARTDVQICSVSPMQFSALLREFPDVSSALLIYLSGLVRDLSDRVYDFSTQNVRKRVQNEVLRLARQAGVSSNTAVIFPKPKHADIASRVNTQREAVTKELSRLVRADLIEKSRRALIVKDFEALRRMAEEALE